MIHIDSSSLRDFLSCRELYRLKWVENRVPTEPAIHREFGVAIHKAIESFWKGESFEAAVHACQQYLLGVSGVNTLPPKKLEKWQAMCGYFPDLIAAYYDAVKQDTEQVFHLDGPCLEYEWQVPFVLVDEPARLVQTTHEPDVTLCGRLDLVLGSTENGVTIHDLKTATAIGKEWKREYREGMLRDIGLGMYDWFLRRQGYPAQDIVLDVLVKPNTYKSNPTPARFEQFHMPELVTDGYRKRFDHLLEWSVREIAEYHQKYLAVKPWPMSTTICQTRYGDCDYLPTCLWGKQSTRPREEHLTQIERTIV